MHPIARLFAIEQQGTRLDPPQRLLLREQLASQRTVAAGSGTAKAIDHPLKRCPALQRYATSGILPIENAIRPIATGKKNWLFATAKLNGLDPARWLADTVEKLPACPNSQIDSLLPFANSTGN